MNHELSSLLIRMKNDLILEFDCLLKLQEMTGLFGGLFEDNDIDQLVETTVNRVDIPFIPPNNGFARPKVSVDPYYRMYPFFNCCCLHSCFRVRVYIEACIILHALC